MALKGAGLPELQDLKRTPMGHLEHLDCKDDVLCFSLFYANIIREVVELFLVNDIVDGRHRQHHLIG